MAEVKTRTTKTTDTTEKTVEKVKSAVEKPKVNYLEELVPFQAFKDGDKYKDDIFVSVGDESIMIQRGKPVMIKRKFYLALMRSQTQDQRTADLITAEKDSFQEEAKKYNI